MATKVQSLYTSYTSTHIQHPTFVDNFYSKYFSRPMRKSALAYSRQSMAPAYPPPNYFKRVVGRICLEYYRYEVTYGVYCMTWGEKLVFNGFIVFVLSLLVWALFVYFPSLLYQKVKRLGWLLTGQGAIHAKSTTLTWSKVGATPTSLITAPPFYT